jgi:hypothetical protein
MSVTIDVDGSPNFGSPTSSSEWQIPAGLGGNLPSLKYDIGPSKGASTTDQAIKAKGTDHYDGVTFIVDAGQVVGKSRTSSFTSRNFPLTGNTPTPPFDNVGGQNAYSVKGNARYNVISAYSIGSEYRNYALTVEDFKAPGANGESAGNGDKVAESRCYFLANVVQQPLNSSLSAIRLHVGNDGINIGQGAYSIHSGSEGCLVSPVYYALRDFLIKRHLADHQALSDNKSEFPAYRSLYGKGHVASKSAFLSNGVDHVKKEEWNDLLVATLWLIRPDERPVG